MYTIYMYVYNHFNNMNDEANLMLIYVHHFIRRFGIYSFALGEEDEGKTKRRFLATVHKLN